MKHTALFAGCLCALALSLPSSAQVLMLDFGVSTAAGADLTNSPLHTSSPTFTDGSWNKLQLADVSSGLLFSDGSAATGVSVNIGATTVAGVTTIGLGNVPSGNSALGSTIKTGVYAGNSVGTDGIFTGSSGNSRAIGLQIGGLSAGTYDIFITGRNTNTSATHVQNFYANKSSSSGDFDFASFTTKAVSYGNTTTSATAAWSENFNYVKFSITLSSGDFINLASLGGTGEGRGFINAVQIVNTSAVPEPATAGLLGGLAALAFTFGLRRRR